MTPEAQRIAIAEAWGFEPGTINRESWLGYCTALHAETLYQLGCDAPDSDEKPDHVLAKVPYFLGDLNAMHEAEKARWTGNLEKFHNDAETYREWCEYQAILRHNIHATAAQRAKAFLLALNLWTE